MPRGKQREKEAPKPGSFGDLLFNLRTSQHLSIKELSRLSGVGRTYITKMEEGERSPSPKVIRQLAGALDVLPLTLKMTTGHIEFWDLYPIDFNNPPIGFSLSDVKPEEEIKLLWFLKYLRSVEA